MQNRRDFLKTASVAAVGTGLLVSCGPRAGKPEKFNVNRLGSGTIKMSYEPYELKLRHTFTVASYSRTTTPDVQLKLEYEGLTGYGEASMPPYLGQSVESVTKFLSKVDLTQFHDPTKMEDILTEIRETVKKGERALILTLTKKMSEDLTGYLKQEEIRVKYLHSDIDTVERMKILRQLRQGEFDVLVGINLLREGLDIPEVSLLMILDADKEGFLRSTRSLIQMIGRAARNVNGRVVFYADEVTDSMFAAVSETNRRREIQMKYNEDNHITPKSVSKEVRDVLETIEEISEEEKIDMKDLSNLLDQKKTKMSTAELSKLAAKLEKDMKAAAKDLAFEEAARLRDLLVLVKGKLSDS